MGKRILFLDYSRVFAAFLVVFAHLYSADSNVRLFIYAFHMPFFFLVSGILHKQTSAISEFVFMKKCVKKLLVPCFFYIIIGAIDFYFRKNESVYGIVLQSLRQFYYGSFMSVNAVVWFLFSLIYVKFFVFFTKKHGGLLKFFVIVVFISFLLRPVWFRYFYVGTALMALPFYQFGCYFGPSVLKFLEKNKNRLFYVVASVVLLVVSVLLTFVNGRVSMACLQFGLAMKPFNILLFYLNGLIGSFSLICMSSIFKKESIICKQIALCLISILGFQQLFINQFLIHIGENQNLVVSALSSFGILGICCLMHNVTKKYLPWVFGVWKKAL